MLRNAGSLIFSFSSINIPKASKIFLAEIFSRDSYIYAYLKQ
jgi:hypothetical protein